VTVHSCNTQTIFKCTLCFENRNWRK